MPKDDEISIKGLDTFSQQFFLSESKDPTKQEFVTVNKGQALSPEKVKAYQEERMREFIQRAGSFTEDLIGFIFEQKSKRNLTDIETVFGVALATINLRNSYENAGVQPGSMSTPSAEQRTANLAEFDNICMGAQDFWDANQ